ncbi:MAG: SH3 domain-containing protein [Clostridia bacterium]|nr:SH3 domain-containing protein [Clostridia bacterium]
MKRFVLFIILIILSVSFLTGIAICEETEESIEYAYVRTEGPFARLNVRSTPSEEFNASCKLFSGVKVRVERRENGWAYISYGTEEDIAPLRGYVQEKYLDDEQNNSLSESNPLPRIRVKNESFFIRNTGWYYTWPQNENDIIPSDTELTVIAVKGNFDLTDATAAFDAYYVETDDGERFWLRNLEQFGIEVLNPQGYTAKTTKSVRMRQGADQNSKALKLLDAGVKVEILLRGEGWTMVKYRNEIGYIMSRYLSFPE